jgi:hypothetical protein
LIVFNTRLQNQDLENYIRNHPEARLARIQSLAKELTDVDVMPGTVQAEAEGLTARWSQLSQKVSTRHTHPSNLSNIFHSQLKNIKRNQIA